MQNNRNRESSNYAPWIIGAVIAVAAVVGITMYGGDNTNVASNDTPSAATSSTTGSGASSGSTGTSGSNTPATPAPTAPRR